MSPSAGAPIAKLARSLRALRLIIAYKLARGCVAILASIVLVVFMATGHIGPLSAMAHSLRHHVTSAWSILLADALVSAVTPAHLWIVATALALDGALTFVEGWSLQRAWWWGPWLVVVATGAFIPFEVVALVHRMAMGRVLLLVANLFVALYMVQHARGLARASKQRAETER